MDADVDNVQRGELVMFWGGIALYKSYYYKLSVLVSSVQDGIYALGKVYMSSTMYAPTFCAGIYFGTRSPCVLPPHPKDPGHSAKGAGGTIQLNTQAPYTYGYE